MAALIKSVYRGYTYIFYDSADPRVTDWFLVGSPFYPLGLITLYLYLVKTAGPWYMKGRPAYKLSGLIALYNFTLIALNASLFMKGIKIFMTQKVFCTAVDYSCTPEATYVAVCAWEYFMTKVLDLMDTIFFILRKKNNQATTLHVYHHVIMVLATWVTLRHLLAGGHGTLLGVLNCFVHVFMYLYYLVTNIWPEYKQNLWWKKYITQMQMAQFGINVLYFLSVLIVPNCQYPVGFSMFIVVQNLIMFLMFYDFYRKAYRKQKNI